MDNTNLNHINRLSWFFLAFCLCVGCITIPHNLSKTYVPSVKKRQKAPVDAFGLIKRFVKVAPISCKSLKDQEKCDEILEKLPDLTASGSGSGMLVESSLGPVVMTAAHVCQPELPTEFTHEGVTIEIESSITFVVKVPTLGQYPATIVRIDRDKDLCLLKTSKTYTHPVPLAKSAPSHGDVVYAISAPYGISGPNMALIFRGFYSGKDVFPHTGKEVRFYTIPTKPGSSGSAVFNESWEVIGVIHTAFTSLESVGIGTGWEDVKEFLYPVKTTSEDEESSH